MACSAGDKFVDLQTTRTEARPRQIEGSPKESVNPISTKSRGASCPGIPLESAIAKYIFPKNIHKYTRTHIAVCWKALESRITS